MKISCIILLLAVTFITTKAQTFEGKISYKVSYKSKLPNLTDEQFASMMGSVMDYSIKGGNYKTSMNGQMLQWQMYLSKDNKLYNKLSNSATIYWNDGAINADEVQKVEVNKGAMEILGLQCDELILTCKSGIQKFYVSPKLKVDPKLFANHKYGNWSEVVSKVNGLPLKMIIEAPQFTMETTATEVTEMKLDDAMFQLPAGAKLEKSPY